MIQSFIFHPLANFPKDSTEIDVYFYDDSLYLVLYHYLSSFFFSSIMQNTNTDTLWVYSVPPVLKWTIDDLGEHVKDKRSTILIIFHNFPLPLPGFSLRIFSPFLMEKITEHLFQYVPLKDKSI